MQNFNLHIPDGDNFPFQNKVLPYTVPAHYFQHSVGAIMDKVKKKSSAYRVSDTYFDTLPYAILQKIKVNAIQQELVEIAPLLSQMSRDNVYSQPPADYFALASDNLYKKTTQKPQIISLEDWKARKNTRKGLLMAAAILGVLLLVGALFNTNTLLDKHSNPSYANITAPIEDSHSYINVINYLETPQNQSDARGNSFVPAYKLNIKEEINTISSEDLEAYLNSTPSIE